MHFQSLWEQQSLRLCLSDWVSGVNQLMRVQYLLCFKDWDSAGAGDGLPSEEELGESPLLLGTTAYSANTLTPNSAPSSNLEQVTNHMSSKGVRQNKMVT